MDSFSEWLRVMGVACCMSDFCQGKFEVTKWKTIKNVCNGQSTSNI
jgi:hypothetical protein